MTKQKKVKKKFDFSPFVAYVVSMNKAELNQQFEMLNRKVNSLPAGSPEYKEAWQARFEVSRELRNFRSLGGDKCRLHDKAWKIVEQNV
jgi:hypothetical protein